MKYHKPLHYIIFHPDKARKDITVAGEAVNKNNIKEDWKGKVWVDSLEGNEDPYVWGDPWFYSYCHATQLKRVKINKLRVNEGSYLFFCSGEAANGGNLKIDTVFVVKKVHQWSINSKWNRTVPNEFQ